MGAVAVWVSGFGSCAVSLPEVCAQRLPKYDAALGEALLALRPWVEQPDRLPASGVGLRLSAELSQDERIKWKQWANDKLIETQNYLDAAAAELADSPMRLALNEIANEWVTFHGFAAQGRAERMKQTLERIQVKTSQVRGLACVKTGN